MVYSAIPLVFCPAHRDVLNEERRRAEEGNGVITIFLVCDWVAWRVIPRPLFMIVSLAQVVGEVVSDGGTASEVVSMAVVMKMAGRGQAAHGQ